MHKKEDYTLLFIHGWTASSDSDFYPPLKKELDALGKKYIIPDLPGGRYPHAEEWLSVIHESVKHETGPLVIVGHSLGTRAALLYIERYQPQVRALFLIAAFANRLENAKRRGGEVYPDFFTHMVDINKVKSCISESYVLHSKDDHSIPLEQGAEIALDLGSHLIVAENRDHFSDPKNAPYILSVLREKLQF
jgi:predicted alpha/beta hydrolase family esterase